MASDQGPIDVNITTPISISNPSIGVNNAVAPLSSTQVGGIDGTGDLQALTVDASNYLNVNVQTSALPTGASTAANQATMISDLSAINGKLNSLGQKAMADSVPVTLASDQSAVPVSLTGTGSTNLAEVAGTATAVNNGTANAGTQRVAIASDNTPFSVNSRAQDGAGTAITSTLVVAKQSLDVNVAQSALPTGAATDTNQFTEIASLSAIQGATISMDSKIANGYGVATSAVRTASQIGNAAGAADFNYGAVGAQTIRSAAQVGNATGAADFGAGNKGAQTLRVVVATDQSSIPVTTAGSTTGSGSAAAATVSTVITLTAPANTTGFILMNMDTSTANVRWAIGRTATATLGQQLQPGRDSGFVPCGANVSLVAESGTQTYDIQWISQ